MSDFYEEAVCEIIFLLLFSGMWFLACRLGVKEGRASQNEQIQLKSL